MKNYLKTLLGALTITAFTVSSAATLMGVSLMYVKLKLMVQKLRELFQELHQKKIAPLNLKITSVVLFSQKLNTPD